MSNYSFTILLDCYFSATYRYATRDFYDGSDNYYKGTLLESPNIDEELDNLFHGVESGGHVTLQLSNVDNSIDDTWYDIVDNEEIRGAWVMIQRHDPTDGYSFKLRGKITDYSLGDEVTLTVEMRDDENLETLLSLKLVTTDDFTATALDVGQAVNICFGHCLDVPLRNVQNDTTNNYYDYLIGYGTIESLWEDSGSGLGVKRDGVLVRTSEYTFYDGSQGSPHPGYAFLRFTTEQRDFSGSMHNLTADVKGLEMGGASAERNFANVIKNILSDTTWGLSDNIDSTSFSDAATDLDTIGSMYCDGAVTSKRQARDIINQLLFVSRSVLQRGSDGEWEITVDGTGSSSANFGENDGYYNNCEINRIHATPAGQAIKTAKVHYRLNPLNKNNPYYELSLDVHVDFGVDKEYELPFVHETDTAKKVLSYIVNRSLYSDKRVSLTTYLEGRSLSRGSIFTLDAPDKNINGKEYIVDSIFTLSREQGKYEIEGREYSPDIWTDATIGDPVNWTSSNIVVTGPETFVGPLHLGDGEDQPATITLQPSLNDQIYIAAGKNKFDNTQNGFILGIDGLDSDLAKFLVGSVTKFLNFNGSDVIIKAGNFELGENGELTTTLSGNAEIVIEDGDSWVKLDANGLTGHDSLLGQTVSIPVDGTPPTFSSGIIEEFVYKIKTAGIIRTAESGRRIVISSDGMTCHSGAVTGKYGQFKYGDGTKYGSGVIAWIFNALKIVPFYVAAEQTVADFHFYNRGSDPSGKAELGDIAMVNNTMKKCSSAGTPGTWDSIEGAHQILAKTSNYSILSSDLTGNTTITNNGASGEINCSLPAGVANYKIAFNVVDAQYLKVTANGSEKIRFYNEESAAGGYIRANVVGTYWELIHNADNWVVNNLVGWVNYDQ